MTQSTRLILKNRKGEEGLALLTVLTIISILGILVVEYSTSIMLDVDSSENFHDRIQAEYNSKAGLQYAIKLLMDDDTPTDSLQDAWAQPQEIFIGDLIRHYLTQAERDELESTAIEEEPPAPVDHGYGKAYILITDEERKLNVNRFVVSASTVDEPYKNMILTLLKNLKYPEVDETELVDALIDWIDDDDTGMAEKSTYYAYLEPPYEPRNAPFQSIHEMLLVRGINRLILFGNTPFPLQKTGLEEEDTSGYYAMGTSQPESEITPVYGLANFVTVYSSTQVNINSAPREVLMALFDEYNVTVDDIIRARLEQPYDRYDQLRPLLEPIAPNYYTSKIRYITFRSRNFLVESVGEYRGARVRTIAVITRRGTADLRIIYQRTENMGPHDRLPFETGTFPAGI